MQRKTYSVLLGLLGALALCAQDTPPDTPQQTPTGGGFGRGGGAAAAGVAPTTGRWSHCSMNDAMRDASLEACELF